MPKLVRDRIPGIIRADSAEPVITVAAHEEYVRELRRKLEEEVAEYLEADGPQAVEELADIMEVVHALAAVHGRGADGVERVRQAKADERGAFTGRFIWHGNR
ncbi:putative house-cleaning noncanonical NTP pyrophosphatase (MazG superfamily) [Nocardiopsis mwathae]|uniref:Putative house-cleaning noncanonical NTP pyrophosphatase (MazG superfamily) n=1 Tax=Nocardiopsis mwathae TaxID=1472723 RepID=A0A7W9YLL7_9ACTN|nr:nucleoside triphosphate pyrophosphohydrolase [Nocardiopsis mwathae]MBB6173821.1 putative house-cleaning noncanonical NTP pyrophosphatase (MazG superfamily) [Nocardiopsis mwathae]